MDQKPLTPHEAIDGVMRKMLDIFTEIVVQQARSTLPREAKAETIKLVERAAMEFADNLLVDRLALVSDHAASSLVGTEYEGFHFRYSFVEAYERRQPGANFLFATMDWINFCKNHAHVVPKDVSEKLTGSDSPMNSLMGDLKSGKISVVTDPEA